MAVPKIFLDGTEINFTIEDSYELELNPVSNKRQWSMEIWAGPNYFKPEQYAQIMALLTSGTHTFVAEDGVSYSVKVSGNPHVSRILKGYPVISLTLAEPGFETEDSGGEIEINGSIAGHSFTAKLADYSRSNVAHGERVSTLTGNFLYSGNFGTRKQWTFNIPWWAGADDLSLKSSYSFSFSYIDVDGVLRTVSGAGALTSTSQSGGTVTLTLDGGVAT